MTTMAHDRLLKSLYRDYRERFPVCGDAHDRARAVLVDGVSHGARLFQPYPFRVVKADGAHVTDIDGHKMVDFWQGHYANILGHNPTVIREALVEELRDGHGLQTGLPEELQTEFAQTLCAATGAERVRLTTSGTLATMYAIMISRAHTGRRLVVKVGGGWHGASPLALKGVGRRADGYQHVDSAGVPASTDQEIRVVRFNDVQGLKDTFERLSEQIACLIFEPCPSAAGFIPATTAFMSTARDLTSEHGAVMILDEVITGFRYCASGVQRLYGVQPDLTTFGKVLGGGMPLSAVVGRADLLDLVGESAQDRVWFNGGTFSAHPLCLLAATTMLKYLMANEGDLYPALLAKGTALRAGIEATFADAGVLARCTGHGNDALKGGSLSTIYFPKEPDLVPTSAEDLQDPALCDVVLRERALKIGLLLHDVNVVHGLGALCTEHGEKDLTHVFQACAAFARRLKNEHRAENAD